MKTVTVKFSVQFTHTFEVDDNTTDKQIMDEISNINIPEDDEVKYVEDTFEVDSVVYTSKTGVEVTIL